MKTSFVFSLTLHIVVFGFLQLLALKPAHKIQKSNIYQIQLVSMPKIQRKVETATSEVKEPVEKVTTPTVNVKNEPKKEIKNNESPKAEKPRPAKVESDSLKHFGEGNVNSNNRGNAVGNIGDSTIKIDIPNFPFAYYLAVLQNRLQENWKPPFQNLDPTIQRTVVMRFKISKDGKITDSEVEKSSGHILFDQAAQRAVWAINPMPPLPDEFTSEYLLVHIEFE